MWESLGFTIAFVYSTFLCTSVKLYVLISVLVVGMTGYCIVEYIIHKSNKDVKTESDQMKKEDVKVVANGWDNKAFSTDL